MRRLTRSEALEMIETTWDCAADAICVGLVEATIPELTTVQAREDVAKYLDIIASEIDPDSISIHRDEIDGSDLDCVRVVIRTGDQAA
jgi:hypothetical protein